MKKILSVLLMIVFLALSGCAVPKYNYSPLTKDISEAPLKAAPLYLEVDIVDYQYEKSLDGQAFRWPSNNWSDAKSCIVCR
jgi:hypothetical protein